MTQGCCRSELGVPSGRSEPWSRRAVLALAEARIADYALSPRPSSSLLADKTVHRPPRFRRWSSPASANITPAIMAGTGRDDKPRNTPPGGPPASGGPAWMAETTKLPWSSRTRGVLRPSDPEGDSGAVVMRESSGFAGAARDAGRSHGGGRIRGYPGPASPPSFTSAGRASSSASANPSAGWGARGA